jgi:hypothetical protein
MPEAPQQSPGPVHLRLRAEPRQHPQGLAEYAGLTFGQFGEVEPDHRRLVGEAERRQLVGGAAHQCLVAIQTPLDPGG